MAPLKSHRTDLRVRLGETDASGVVFYANYFSWFNVAGDSFFRELGFDLRELWARQKTTFVATQAAANFLSAARHNDALEILTSVSEIGQKTLGLTFQVLRKVDGRPLATGRVSLMCVKLDQDNKLGAVEIPEKLVLRLQELAPVSGSGGSADAEASEDKEPGEEAWKS